MNGPEGVGDGADGVDDRLLVGDVNLHGQALAGHLVHRALGSVTVTVESGDPGTGAGQGECGGAAEARAGAGDEGDLVSDLHGRYRPADSV